MSGNRRLFLAVNIPEKLKQEISEEAMALIPKNGWRKVLQENLHVTLQFLGYFPEAGLKELEEKLDSVELDCFEAEVNCAGHFKGRVIWLGFGKGNEEFKLLNRRLQQALGTHDERFHAHITLARNKGSEKGQAQSLVEKIGKGLKPKLFEVKSFELMESRPRKHGPVYTVVFSRRLTQPPQKPA